MAFEQGGDDGTLRYRGRLCVPYVDRLKEQIMLEAHNSRYSIHPGESRTPEAWRFNSNIEIPIWKWEMIKMDFIIGLPRSFRKHDSIWVIVDRLTKSAHFLPVKTTDSAEDYAKLYIKEIFRLHGTPLSIISDRDAQFTANFWKYFQKGLGTRVNLSTAFHPHIDGQAERTIQTHEDMLRGCVNDFKVSRWHRTKLCMDEGVDHQLVGSSQRSGILRTDLVYQAMEKVNLIQRHLKTAQSRQNSNSDMQRRDLEFQVDDWLFLKKFMRDPSLVVPIEIIGVKDSLSYEEILVAILDRQIYKLRTKEITSVKVLWRNQRVEEATWEAEEDMKSIYHISLKSKRKIWKSKIRVEDDQLRAPSGSVHPNRFAVKPLRDTNRELRFNKEQYQPYADRRNSGPSCKTPRSDRRNDRGQSSRGLMSKSGFDKHTGPVEALRLSEYNFSIDASGIVSAIERIKDIKWPRPKQTDPS
uniref:Uncharacterized protein LOC104220269 n=1 Tax=Nicotiana sylvestris TaxID=4096 RepID=A0A1U7VNC3_NICSY|nr:PREDICTED: uncharacterized protein LOC104220269 [Nicotiana sylvestris]